MIRLLFLAALSICTTGFAQTNFVPARVVMLNGDTVDTNIDNGDWNKNPKKISSKHSNGGLKDYTSLEIQGFYLTESKEWFRSAIVTIDKSSIKSADVLKNINLRGQDTDTLFLRLLVRGRLNLYSLTDEFSRRHFLVEKNGPIEELKLEKKRVLTPKEGVVVLEHFKGQLSSLVADCGQAPAITKIQYSEKSLVEFVIRYNECTGGQQYAAPIAKSEFRFSVLAGVHHTALTYKVQDVTRKYDPSTGPVGGVGLEVIFPRNRGSLSFNNEVIYKSYSVTYTNTTINTTNTFKANQLKLFTGFRYRVPAQNATRIFFGINVVNGLAVSHEVITQGNKDFRTHEQGVAVDAGVQGRRFQYLVRYEMANGFSPGPAVQTRFSCVYGSIAFALTK